jgi:addiction module RelE/StbE family toxin
MKVRYTPQAKSDLTEIFSHIAEDNARAARGVIATIRQDITLLSDNPRLGRLGRVSGTRELVGSQFPYVVAYRATGDLVEILAVLHTARDWPSSL